MYVLKMLITLDIVVPLLEFISKEEKDVLKDLCLTLFMPKTIKSFEYLLYNMYNARHCGYSGEQNRQALHSRSLSFNKTVL